MPPPPVPTVVGAIAAGKLERVRFRLPTEWGLGCVTGRVDAMTRLVDGSSETMPSALRSLVSNVTGAGEVSVVAGCGRLVSGFEAVGIWLVAGAA